MKGFVLIKILQTMYYNSKNKILGLSFYDSSLVNKLEPSNSLEEFEERVPSIYYEVKVGADLCELYVYQYTHLEGKHTVLSVQDNFDIADLQSLNISEFTPYKYYSTSNFSGGGTYSQNHVVIKYDALLFVEIFRLLDECCNLYFRSQNIDYLAHYVNGKIIVSEILPYVYTVTVTSLFDLNNKFKDCEILDFTPHHTKITMPNLFKSIEEFCQQSGLKYQKDSVSRR